MVDPQPRVREELERYLRTGDHDVLCQAWPGSLVERAQRADAALRAALLEEVRRLAGARPRQARPAAEATVALTRRRVEPMVRGLFPCAEQEAVLAVLERSVVFLTEENIDSILRCSAWLSTAWDLANLYLASIGADLLSGEARAIVGLSQATTCYVSPTFFEESGAFEDVIVHEAAHIFHNCKRRAVGLRETRQREWLLDIEFRLRETFAYSCEAYACILARARSAAERRNLAAEYGAQPRVADERVDAAQVAGIVAEAATARNGWKVILTHCAPRSRSPAAAAASRRTTAGAT